MPPLRYDIFMLLSPLLRVTLMMPFSAPLFADATADADGATLLPPLQFADTDTPLTPLRHRLIFGQGRAAILLLI